MHFLPGLHLSIDIMRYKSIRNHIREGIP